jgi:hypothetical protein
LVSARLNISSGRSAHALMTDLSGVTRSGIDKLMLMVTDLEFLPLSANVPVAPVASRKDSSSIDIIRMVGLLDLRTPMLEK